MHKLLRATLLGPSFFSFFFTLSPSLSPSLCAGQVLLSVMGLGKYQREPALMMKATGMLDNVVSADEEFATIVTDKGGRALVETIARMYEDDEVRPLPSPGGHEPVHACLARFVTCYPACCPNTAPE